MSVKARPAAVRSEPSRWKASTVSASLRATPIGPPPYTLGRPVASPRPREAPAARARGALASELPDVGQARRRWGRVHARGARGDDARAAAALPGLAALPGIARGDRRRRHPRV